MRCLKIYVLCVRVYYALQACIIHCMLHVTHCMLHELPSVYVRACICVLCSQVWALADLCCTSNLCHLSFTNLK